jgi:hypothetical protein
MKSERFQIPLPGGRTGTAEIRVDLERLVTALWWKAYYSQGKRATLQNDAIILDIVEERPDPKAQS